MKIFFDHIAGNITSRELVYSPATAIFEKNEYEYAVENGWHIAESWGVDNFDWFNDVKAMGGKVWYQARSTRIDTDKFSERSRHRKRIRRAGLEVKTLNSESIDRTRLWQVYQSYINKKGFSDFYSDKEDLFTPVYGTRSYITYTKDSKLIAFSILEEVGSNSQIALQFAWDYENPDLGVGYINKLYQFRLMKDRNRRFMYLGNSYEKPSLGKSEYAGFEWWDGRKWSGDVELFRFLLKKESSISTLEELYELQREYYSRWS